MALVRNDSTAVVPAFAAMRITGVVEHKRRTAFTVAKPDGSDGPHLINGPVPLGATGDGRYGEAQDGVIVSAFYDTADAPDVGDELGPENAEWKLTSSGGGWVFLGALSGENIGLFRQAGGGGTFFGKADVPGIDAGAVGTVSRWSAGPANLGAVDTSDNKTGVYALVKCPENAWCTVTRIQGNWYATPIECPPTV